MTAERTHPTNAQRAERIVALMAPYAQAAGLTPEDAQDESACALDLLTDLMHFCEQRGHDFDDLLNLADLAYRAEQEGPGPLPLPEPLLQPRA
jgi:hypothetical protein